MVVVAAVVNHYHVVDSMRPLIATTSVGGYNKLLCVFACLCWAMVYQRYNIYNIYWSLCPNPVRTHTTIYRQWRCRSESGNFGTLSRIKHFHTDREFSSKPRTRVGCGNPGVGPSTERNQRGCVVARARDINAVKIESVTWYHILTIYIYNKYIVCQPVYIYIVCESIDPLTLSQSSHVFFPGQSYIVVTV